MLTLSRTLILALAALLLHAPETSFAAQDSWDQIDLTGPIETTLPDGTTRTLMPSCTGGPQLVPDVPFPVPADTQYYFFVQAGNPNKILIGLDGGGACWDAATCIGSPLTGNSTYTVALDETPARLADSEGFFDSSNPDNPFHNYTKIFVPYCSGDVHWGSTTTVYDFGGLQWPIHHRGLDNVLGVLDWLQKNGRRHYRIDFARARDVTVTGASAGGYGANVAFAYVAELTPRARHSLISDAAIGVLTDDFYRTAIFDPASPDSASWGVEGSLPSWVPGFDTILAQGAAFPNGFVPSVFAALAAYKPDAKMASLTTNLDLVQVFFYSLMKGEPPAAVAGEWYFWMTQLTAAAASLPNYRFFIEDGTFHTFIGGDATTYGVGANGISLAEWVRAMIKPGNRVWDNLDAGPPSP